MAWVTAADVALHLGSIADDDPRLLEVVAASDAWTQRKRPDLDPTSAPPADVALAAVLYAAYLFRLRTAPQGLPGIDEFGNQIDTGDSMANIFRLLGARRMVIR